VQLYRSARALSKASESLDRIASAVFRAKGDQSKRNQIYSGITLMAFAAIGPYMFFRWKKWL
jgi:hypothetical protein